jgi:hypothetical protein
MIRFDAHELEFRESFNNDFEDRTDDDVLFSFIDEKMFYQFELS